MCMCVQVCVYVWCVCVCDEACMHKQHCTKVVEVPCGRCGV